MYLGIVNTKNSYIKDKIVGNNDKYYKVDSLATFVDEWGLECVFDNL